MSLRLRPFRLEDEDAARAAHEELAADDFTFLLAWEPDQPWARYLERMRDMRQGIGLRYDWVPSSFLAADVGGELVGRVSIRHELNRWLVNYGGHIGYAVRPAHRRRGYALEILRQSLVIARAEGVDDVLVTCDDRNVASAAVIERCGGVLEDVRPAEGVMGRRYWIR